MKNIKYGLIGLAIAFSISGASALAADISFRDCADIAEFSRRTISSISERSTALKNARMERLNDISKHWQQQDAEKTIAREIYGQEKSADFAPLERSMANASKEDKLALENFKDALEAASKERKLTVDAANAKFRLSVRTLLQDHSEGFSAAAGEFASSVQSSLSNTAAWCVAGASQGDLRLDVMSKLQSARERFEGDSRAALPIAPSLRELTAQYKADIHAATEAFKAKVIAAQADFKAALQN